MNISETGGVQGPQPIQPAQPPRPPRTYAPSKPPRADGVEISREARLLEKISRMPEVRQEKVDALKKAIEEGAYETEERLSAAIDQLLEESI